MAKPKPTEILPLEHVLRTTWSTRHYLKGDVQHKQTFLVEDGSRVHIQRIAELMQSDYDWATIAMISLLASESETIGSWAEGCMCHCPSIHDSPSTPEARQEAKTCAFRCCRAPELAAGHGLERLCKKMVHNKGTFNEYVARAPQSKRSELVASWTTACSKLFGQITAKLGYWQELPWLLCQGLSHHTWLFVPVRST